MGRKERESWLLCFVCLPGVSCDWCVALPSGASGFVIAVCPDHIHLLFWCLFCYTVQSVISYFANILISLISG